MRRRRLRGYTIIELVVVLAVIAVLASIAIPKLRHAFKRARMVEAVQTISTIERTLKEHFNRTGEYPHVSGAPNPPVPAGEKAAFDLTRPGWKDISFKSNSAYWYRYEFVTTADAAGKYTNLKIIASGDTDGDSRALVITREYEDGTLIGEFQSDD